MSIRTRLVEFTTLEEIESFLKENPTTALFKAGGCHKTMQGFGYVDQAVSKYPDLSIGFVRVIENRPVSNYIAEKTGIKHESPQFILMIDQTPVFDLDNWDITLPALDRALRLHLGPPAESNPEDTAVHLEPYIDLLQNYLSGCLPEEEFSEKWIMTFKMDSSLRSTEEFTLLSQFLGAYSDEPLKERASALLETLKKRHDTVSTHLH